MPSLRTIAPLAAMTAGLLLAGFGLLQHAPPWRTRVPPGYVALVNQRGILMSDFISRTATEMEEPFTQTTPAQRAKVLHEMIDEELVVQRGLALDLPETTVEVRTAMADAVFDQIGETALVHVPTEAQLRAYYRAHRDMYENPGAMTFRNLVLRFGAGEGAQNSAQAQSAAFEAAYQLRSGASIESVMDQFGFVDADPQAHAEQLSNVVRKLLGPKLFQVASTLETGDVSDPIVASDGVHLLVMLNRRPPSPKGFGPARPVVYNDFRVAERNRLSQQLLARLRQRAQIVLAPGMSE